MEQRKHFITALALGVATLLVDIFLLGQGVSAAPIVSVSDKPLLSFSSILDKQAELEQSSSLVLAKIAQVDAMSEELSQLENKKASLEAEVLDLKQALTKLDSMFVHINRYAYDSRGNTYVWGNCTYYAKSQRPDISNSWGNANTWYARAQAQGWNVGLTPKKGAIATTVDGYWGHVAYVEKVTLDGQWVTISEMNFSGFNIISTRVVHYSEFRYIYELD